MALQVVVLKGKDKLKGHGGPRASTTGIVLHGTGGSHTEGAVETLRERNLSYHYIVDTDGTVTKCIDSTVQGWHAGVSEGWAGKWCNRYTIGIAFANPETGKNHPITEAQYGAVKELVLALKGAYPDLHYVTTHYGVSYPRKSDPIVCDTHRVAKDAGLEYWPGRRADGL